MRYPVKRSWRNWSYFPRHVRSALGKLGFTTGATNRNEIVELTINATQYIPCVDALNAGQEIAELIGASRLSRGKLRRYLQNKFLLFTTPNIQFLYLFHPDGYIREEALYRIESEIPKKSLSLLSDATNF